MRYLYPGELKHQIFEFGRAYRWKKDLSPEAFSEEFIMAQLAIDRSRIPAAALARGVAVTKEVIPEERFARISAPAS